jgi:hypothetical protein
MKLCRLVVPVFGIPFNVVCRPRGFVFRNAWFQRGRLRACLTPPNTKYLNPARISGTDLAARTGAA